MERDTSTKLEHIWEAMTDINTDYPQSIQSNVKNGEKGLEEAQEFALEATNDPNEYQMSRMISENVDRFLTCLWFFKDNGITATMALDYALGKMIELRQRWESGYYPKTMQPDVEYTPPYFDDLPE